MPLDFLRETFDTLNKLNEEAFELTDDGIDELKDFEDENQDEDDTVDVIDPTAETEEEANSTAHVGQVICECKVCHSNIFLEKEDVEYDVETELCNESDECPYCGESGGFELIGEITEFKPEEKEEVKEETEEEETSELDDEVEETEEETEVKEESLKENALLGGAIASAAAGFGSALGDKVGDKLFGEEKECKDCDDEEVYKSKHICKDGEKCDECNESIENISFSANGNKVTADDEKITIEADTGVSEAAEEIVEPISTETAEEIVSNAEEEEEPLGEPSEENPEEETEEETEVDIDEIKEESFNTLGTNFLKRTYENVESFRTTSVKANDSKMVLEGIINFKSGTKKKTSFTFESATATKDGKLKFIGENKDIARGNKAFLIEGKIDNKSLIVESLRYNYRAKTPNGKSIRVSGTIKNDT